MILTPSKIKKLNYEKLLAVESHCCKQLYLMVQGRHADTKFNAMHTFKLLQQALDITRKEIAKREEQELAHMPTELALHLIGAKYIRHADTFFICG